MFAGFTSRVENHGLLGGAPRLERVSNLYRQAERVRNRQRSAGDRLLQRVPFEQLENEKLAAVVLPDVMERADVRVIERGNRFGFATEPLPVSR